MHETFETYTFSVSDGIHSLPTNRMYETLAVTTFTIKSTHYKSTVFSNDHLPLVLLLTITQLQKGTIKTMAIKYKLLILKFTITKKKIDG